ncbi:hypothetical protein [Archaeoglobus sp.]
MSLETVGYGIAKGFLAHIGAKLADKTFKLVEKSSYGKVRLSLFLVVDFVEPLRLDDWKIRLNDILTSIGFKRDGNEYIAENVRIKDVAPDYLYLPTESEEDYEEERDNVSDFDDGVLYVKRMKIYAVPEKIDKKCLSEAVSKLADIAEGFIQYINPSKTFFGMRIVFEDVSKASKFKEEAQERLNKFGVRQVTYQSDNMVDVMILSIAKATAAFEIIENELFGGYLSKIKRII